MFDSSGLTRPAGAACTFPRKAWPRRRAIASAAIGIVVVTVRPSVPEVVFFPLFFCRCVLLAGVGPVFVEFPTAARWYSMIFFSAVVLW